MIAVRCLNDWLVRLATGAPTRPLMRFLLFFIGAFLVLQWAYQAMLDTAAYRFYLETLTVRPSAALIQWLAPEDGVLARGRRLVWAGGGLAVYKGCDGMEVMQLLLAAFVAMVGPWRQRLWGASLGLVLIYALNQARIVGLYWAARHERAWFELLHGMIGPLLIIALTTLFFAWWTGRDATPRAA